MEKLSHVHCLSALGPINMCLGPGLPYQEIKGPHNLCRLIALCGSIFPCYKRSEHVWCLWLRCVHHRAPGQSHCCIGPPEALVLQHRRSTPALIPEPPTWRHPLIFGTDSQYRSWSCFVCSLGKWNIVSSSAWLYHIFLDDSIGEIQWAWAEMSTVLLQDW